MAPSNSPKGGELHCTALAYSSVAGPFFNGSPRDPLSRGTKNDRMHTQPGGS